MNDEKSTNDIRLIAQDVVTQRNELCEAKRDAIDARLREAAEQTRTNATAIGALTTNIATLAETVKGWGEKTDGNTERIGVLDKAVDKLKTRPALLAGIGALVGAAAPIVVDIFLK